MLTRRKIPNKKLCNLLKKQEHLTHEKLFNPGQVEFANSPSCKASLVNFFGDVHTEVFTLKTNHRDKVLGVGCSNGEVKVYDIYQGDILSIGHSSRLHDFPCTSFRWKPRSNGHFVVCNCDGTIKWYNRAEETPYGHFESEERAYLCSDYQAGEEWAIFGTDHNTIEVFDSETMKPTHTYTAGGPSELTPNHHTNRVYCLKCLPDDHNLFLSGGWDSTVHLWDTRVRSGSVRKICGPSITSDSLDLKGNVLLAGNYQNNEIAQLFDLGTGSLLQTLDIGEPENSISYCFTAAFAHHSQHNLIAVGLAGSNKVKLLCDNQLVSEVKLQAAPLSLDFCQQEGRDYLIVGGIEGTIYSIQIKITK